MRITRSLRRGRLLGTVAVLTIVLVAAGCAKRSTAQGTNAATKGVSAAKVKIAYVPGGPHPYFQPWKTAMNLAKTDFVTGQILVVDGGRSLV